MFIKFEDLVKDLSHFTLFNKKNDKINYQEVLENISHHSENIDPILENSIYKLT